MGKLKQIFDMISMTQKPITSYEEPNESVSVSMYRSADKVVIKKVDKKLDDLIMNQNQILIKNKKYSEKFFILGDGDTWDPSVSVKLTDIVGQSVCLIECDTWKPNQSVLLPERIARDMFMTQAIYKAGYYAKRNGTSVFFINENGEYFEQDMNYVDLSGCILSDNRWCRCMIARQPNKTVIVLSVDYEVPTLMQYLQSEQN